MEPLDYIFRSISMKINKYELNVSMATSDGYKRSAEVSLVRFYQNKDRHYK